MTAQSDVLAGPQTPKVTKTKESWDTLNFVLRPAVQPSASGKSCSSGGVAEGYRPSNYVIYCKSQFGRAYLDIGGIRRTDNALIQSLAVFCTLPSGYRPKREIVRSVDLLDAVGAPAGTGHIHICTNGDVYVTALNSNTYGVMGEYEFWAAS